MTSDEVIKRLREGIPPANREESEEYMRAMGIPELPTDMVELLREADEATVLRACFSNMIPIVKRILKLIPGLQERCVVCITMREEFKDTEGRLCPICTEELKEFSDATFDLAKLVRVSNAAYAPGTHASAQREARQEKDAAKKDDNETR